MALHYRSGLYRPLAFIVFLNGWNRIPKKAQLPLSLTLVAMTGLAYWFTAVIFGSLTTLYPFLFLWLQSIWTLSAWFFWQVVKEDIPQNSHYGRVAIVLFLSVLIGVGVDLSGKLKSHYVRAQNILMWRMPEVAVAYDLRAPFRLVKARSRVLFPSTQTDAREMVDLGRLNGPTTKPHILIIVMDAFRYDRMTAESTPHTFALARTGTSFSKAYSPSPTTEYSLASLMTGLNPSHLLALESVPLTFPQYLSHFGYETGVNAPLDWSATVFPIAASGPGYNWKDVSGTRDDTKSLPAAVERIVASAKPRFEYVHLMGTHGPFKSTKGYEVEVRKADKLIGNAVEKLRTAAKLENTIIVVAGDHGEALGEHGMWAHSQSLYEEQTRIPIVFNRVVGNPTDYLSLANVPALLSGFIDGDFPRFENDPTFAVQEFHIITTLMWRSIRQGKWAYHRRVAQEDELLFDLEKDPLELNDISSNFPEVMTQFRNIEKRVLFKYKKSTFDEK